MEILRGVTEKAAAAVASLAVGAGWWWIRDGRPRARSVRDSRQRPHIYLPGLTARPWWDGAMFPWVSRLESHAGTLRRELDALLAQGYLKPPPIETIDARKRDFDQRLVRTGSWHLYRLFYNGLELETNSARCPETTRLFRSIPDQWGTVGFGVLGPHSHVQAHCGPINSKLRVHLGLKVPDDCGIRVGGEVRRWEEGRCLVFDDSFEHEVWNWSDSPRYIFMIDVHHPDLAVQEKAWVEKVSTTIIRRAPRRMRTALEYEPRAQSGDAPPAHPPNDPAK